MKWLIESQIEQMDTGVLDPHAGDLNYDTAAPWLAWGPYMWANGTEPRSDGLVWPQEDFAPDGVHPSPSGQQKVGSMLLDFFKTSPHTRSWFLDSIAGDYDHDSDVDGADFLQWQRYLGNHVTPGLGADGNSNGIVDAADYGVWRDHFGAAYSTASTSVPAPEPAMWKLVIVSALALRGRRGISTRGA